MARITVEDCIIRVPNRFELIMLAAQRARELSKGVPPTVEVENDKSHVVALREIAEATIDPAAISETLLNSMSGVDHDDDRLDESDDILFEMEGPSEKFDFDQAIRDWERDGADMDDEGPMDQGHENSDSVDGELRNAEDALDDFADSVDGAGDDANWPE